MRGLKIHEKWLKKIISKEKTMEVRPYRLKDVEGKRIAFGNTKTGFIEAYATVTEIIKFPLSDVAIYEKEHCATQGILERYADKEFLFGYRIAHIEEEHGRLPYPKHPSPSFTIA
jgi:hypothetical protein